MEKESYDAPRVGIDIADCVYRVHDYVFNVVGM